MLFFSKNNFSILEAAKEYFFFSKFPEIKFKFEFKSFVFDVKFFNLNLLWAIIPFKLFTNWFKSLFITFIFEFISVFTFTNDSNSSDIFNKICFLDSIILLQNCFDIS